MAAIEAAGGRVRVISNLLSIPQVTSISMGRKNASNGTITLSYDLIFSFAKYAL